MGYYLDETTFTDELIAFLLSCRSNSIRKKILWERVQKRRKISRDVYCQSIYRLKKRGIIQDKNGIFHLAQKGEKFFYNTFRKIKTKPIKTCRVMIIFDIPERKRKVRSWIRRQIKDWDFKMVQKSVWIGYGPVPEEFTKRLKILKVYDGVKIYDIRKKK